MKQSIILLTLLCVISLNANAQYSVSKNIPEEAKELTNPYSGDKSLVKPGSWVYQKYCWVCHGNNGMGNGPMAGDIKTQPVNFNNSDIVQKTDGQLFWRITNGGENMQPYKEVISDKERWMVVNYIRSLQKKL